MSGSYHGDSEKMATIKRGFLAAPPHQRNVGDFGAINSWRPGRMACAMIVAGAGERGEGGGDGGERGGGGIRARGRI